MGKLIRFLFLLVIVVFGLSFALLNDHSVTMDWYFGAAAMPLSLALVIALIIGAMLGVLAAVGALLRQRRELARLRRSNENARKELNELRKLPMKQGAA